MGVEMEKKDEDEEDFIICQFLITFITALCKCGTIKIKNNRNVMMKKMQTTISKERERGRGKEVCRVRERN
mgnify:CR=1 FL=1